MKKKLWLKIWIVVLVIWMISFSDWTFAADWKDPFGSVAWFFNVFFSMLQRLWIPMANFAWEFLTNNWVYGEAIGLDALLRQYRNVIKNIANFCLWGYFVYTIFKALIKKDDISKKIKDILLWLMVAGVWIQASWFLTAAVLDVSTITLAVAWSLPSQMVSTKPELEGKMKVVLSWFLNKEQTMVVSWYVYNLLPTDAKANETLSVNQYALAKPIPVEQFLDSLMPNQHSVSGPLIFMWQAILDTTMTVPTDNSSTNWLKKTILNTILVSWTTVVYSIEMIVLCVMAIFRVIYLWMFIILSPLAILLWCLQKSGEKFDEKKWLWSFLKNIQIKTFLLNAFKPTIIVLWMWIAVMFTTLMAWVINTDATIDFDNNWVKFSSVADITSNAVAEKSYTTTMESGYLKFTLAHAAKWFMEVLLSILTVVLVYCIIRFAVNMWKWDDFVSKKTKNLQKTAQDLITSTPFIPVTWYDKQWVPTTKYMSAKSAFNLPNEAISRRQGKIDEKNRSQQSEVIDSLFKNENFLSEWQKNQIISAKAGKTWMNALEAQRTAIRKIRDDKNNKTWKSMTLNKQNDNFWIKQFEEWLNVESDKDNVSESSRKLLLGDWKNLWEDKSIEKLFKKNEQRNVKTYVDFFGLDKNITSWWELQNADISKKLEK